MLKHFYSLIKYFVRENGQICQESKLNSFIKRTINNQHLVKVLNFCIYKALVRKDWNYLLKVENR